MPTPYWCPHQVLKATAAPVVAKKHNILAIILYQQGGQIMPTLYWCPHQVLKATGAPVVAKKTYYTGVSIQLLQKCMFGCKNVVLVAKRYIVLDVAKQHVESVA